jgi:hypothetical protein
MRADVVDGQEFRYSASAASLTTMGIQYFATSAAQGNTWCVIIRVTLNMLKEDFIIRALTVRP